jgi:hypothetical protein
VVVTAPPTVTVVPSGPTEIRGVVGRIDSGRSVIELMDGRKILVSADTEVFTGNGRRVTMVSSTVLPPGTSIVARASRPWVTIGGTTTAIAPYASGTVVRVDPGGAVVLNDGRVVTATRDTVFLIDNRPVAVATLVPGHRVVIYQAPGLYVEEPAASPFFPDVQDYEALPQSAG